MDYRDGPDYGRERITIVEGDVGNLSDVLGSDLVQNSDPTGGAARPEGGVFNMRTNGNPLAITSDMAEGITSPSHVHMRATLNEDGLRVEVFGVANWINAKGEDGGQAGCAIEIPDEETGDLMTAMAALAEAYKSRAMAGARAAGYQAHETSKRMPIIDRLMDGDASAVDDLQQLDKPQPDNQP